MLRFAADENFNNHILDGLRRRKPDLDVVRVQVGRKIAVSTAIEEILLMAACSLQGEWAGTVTDLPLR